MDFLERRIPVKENSGDEQRERRNAGSLSRKDDKQNTN